MGKEETNNSERWQQHIESQRISGKSQAQYCRENALDIKRFGYWLRKFRPENEARGKFVEITSSGMEVFKISIKGGAVTIEVPSSYGLTKIVEELDV